MKNWRRAFMRIVAWILHNSLDTYLDIVDDSPREGENLSETEIVIRAKIGSDTPIPLKEFMRVGEQIHEALECKEYDVSLHANTLVFTFKGCMEEGS